MRSPVRITQNTGLTSLEKCSAHLLSRTAHKGGFTLLEVLVALTIFSAVIAALYSAFFLSHKAADTVGDSLLRLQESRAFLDTIKREIESALYDPGADSSNLRYMMFKLDGRDFYGRQASQLVFTAFTPLLSGLAKITYTVEEHDKKLTLRKKVISAFAKKDEAKTFELMEDIEAFIVEVKYNDKWVKTWDTALIPRLPEQVRISLKVLAKKERNPVTDQEPSSFTVSDVAKPKIGGMI